MSNYPQQGRVYTVREIQSLKLDDTPFLRVPAPESMGGGITAIQGEGITSTEVVAVIGELKFRYIRTTHEWIPLFDYAGSSEELATAVDIELHRDPHCDRPTAWATVKGFYEEQDYQWDGDFLTASYMAEGEGIQAPHYLIEARDKLAS